MAKKEKVEPIELTEEELNGFMTIIRAYQVKNHPYYQVLLLDTPVVISNMRIFRTPGAAKTAIRRAIFNAMWHHWYWSSYTENQSKHNPIFTKEQLDDAFRALVPKLTELKAGQSGFSSASISKLAKSILEFMLNNGTFKVEKIN